MAYLFILALIAITVAFSVIARKKINECESEEERRTTKAKWQLICGIMGGACILSTMVIIFIMF